MIKEIQSLLDLIDDYDLFLFDQWGVIHDGKNIFPKAEEVFLHLQNLKKQAIIISNSGKKSSDNISSCLLYTSPSPRDRTRSRMPSSA